ncbi:MAG: CpaF family protein, partial [Granulosicoccus sp.]
REQVSSAVDIILQQQRFPCGSRRITRITEVVGMESGTVQLQDIFRFEPQAADSANRGGKFVATGAIPTFYESLNASGIAMDLSAFQLSNNGGML